MLQRRLERDIALYGGAPPAVDSIVDGSDSEFGEEDEDSDPVPSVSGIILKLILPHSNPKHTLATKSMLVLLYYTGSIL